MNEQNPNEQNPMDSSLHLYGHKNKQKQTRLVAIWLLSFFIVIFQIRGMYEKSNVKKNTDNAVSYVWLFWDDERGDI